ncbi:MAG: hypothetical protein LIO87_10270 [Eubacterium sp.]|nr:hypothetical protein [Eubacterium sp.]
MDYLYYQQKINDVIIKCPIETGIEILVYNLLDKYIDTENYALVAIDRVWKKQDSRLLTKGGISDIAILSTDFIFKAKDSGHVYGFIEVKSAGTSLYDTLQIDGQKEDHNHLIYTNGIVWKYYYKKECRWEINISKEGVQHSISEINVDKNQFEK